MSELSLDLKPIAITTSSTSTTTTYVPQSINVFLGEVSLISNVSEKFSKVDGFVQRLRDEMNKIEAFKRELPLCMLLLKDAIGALMRETMQWNTSGSSSAAAAAAAVIMEKCVPLKSNSSEIDLRDKKNWMSSAQLWTSNGYSSKTDDEKPKSVVNEVIAKKDDGSAATTIETILPRNGGGAFVPFKGFTGFLTSTRREEKEKEIQLEAGLSLVTPGVKKPRIEPTTSCLMNSKTCGGTVSRGLPASSSENTHQTNLQMPLPSQPPRKQRRCWSADLHRRFLHALQQLGGSQAATPKQIRELMKVDGLTNDEVKSHLQKYRLHTRRFPANASSPGSENKKLALFGGLWAPEDQCGASKASTSQSESPQGPLHLMTSRGSTTGDDSMEDDEEDGKSESYTWKGHFYKPGDDEA